MSGSDIPYHLRPHKAVDRRLFLDLLGRCDRWRALDDYVYLSMGAYPMEDHKLIYRRFGLRRLISFDLDQAITRRQMFNRPILGCKCLAMTSGQVVAKLEKVLADCGHADADGLILWLDYTSAGAVATQLREFQAALGAAADGDILRLTLNAHPDNLSRGTKATGPALFEERLALLRKRMGDFLPTKVTSAGMTEAAFPKVLASAVGLAAVKALPPPSRSVFAPLSLISYSDGQQMLTVTGMKLLASDLPEMRKAVGLSDWSFGSPDWGTVHKLTVVDLTTRERLYLEQRVASATAEEMTSEMGFDFDATAEAPGFLESYKRYSRFYPSYLSAEV